MINRETTRFGPGEGRSLWVLGELVTCKVTSEQTGGAYSLFEVVSQPRGGPPPYIEHQEDECFSVLEGEFEFLDNERTIRAGVGALIYIPRGNLRGYKNVGDEPGRMLVSQTPGGLHERFFEEVGEEARDLTTPPPMDASPDVDTMATIAARYGIEIPPSPGSEVNSTRGGSNS